MKRVSILNEVLGPIMRGSSSSHTAGPWRIGRIVRDLLGEKPVQAVFSFHPDSSLAICYHEQGSDLAFIAGLLGRDLTDPHFPRMCEIAPLENLTVTFQLKRFPEADHPNSTFIEVIGEKGTKVACHARSIGGGSIEIPLVNGVPTQITGDRYELIIFTHPFISAEDKEAFIRLMNEWDPEAHITQSGSILALYGRSFSEPPRELLNLSGTHSAYFARPILFPPKGEELFPDTDGLLALAKKERWSLGEAALHYEESLLQLPLSHLNAEMDQRLAIMLESVEAGLKEETPSMKLLTPTARKISQAEKENCLFTGGVHTRAAIRALATMQINSSGGVVCAAPTGGSAGVIPGILSTLIKDFGFDKEKSLKALWAAGAIGLAIARRSTFAAEMAGCQVEIGAAGAMGAAAVVEGAGGTPQQACNAAAIVLQNIMGSVCDLVQGIVEIPCHTRNAALASQAFLSADLVLGGYENPIPLDETIDAMHQVGRMLPPELRCTSKGGIACCPSAQKLQRKDAKRL